MLTFERKVVSSLVAAGHGGGEGAVEGYVDGALAALPEYMRAGVAAESLVLGSWEAMRSVALRGEGRDIAGFVAACEQSRIGVIRQYVRLMRSLVLFAEHELAPGAGG